MARFYYPEGSNISLNLVYFTQQIWKIQGKRSDNATQIKLYILLNSTFPNTIQYKLAQIFALCKKL